MNYLIPAPQGVDADNGTILITDDQDILRLSGMATDTGSVFLFLVGNAFHAGKAELDYELDNESSLLFINLVSDSVVTHLRSSTDEDTMALIDARFRLGPLASFSGDVVVLINEKIISAGAPV